MARTELDIIVLTTDLAEHGLKSGDLGTVVLVHEYNGYEVEFMTFDGETITVVSLSPNQYIQWAAEGVRKPDW
jgi:hypothetical protein